MSNTSTSGVGFAGLSAHHTDVDAAIADSDRIATLPRTPASAANDDTLDTLETVHRDRGSSIAGIKKVGGWVIGIGVVIAIKAAFFAGIHSTQTPPATPTDNTPVISINPDQSAATQSSDAPPAGDGWSIVNDASTASSENTPSTSDASSTPPAYDASDTGTDLSKPAAYGVTTLTPAELRYCLSETIRIHASSAALDELRDTDTDRFNRDIDTYNASIDDYNNRCNNRSYRSNEKSAADQQVEAQRSSLENEGRERVL